MTEGGTVLQMWFRSSAIVAVGAEEQNVGENGGLLGRSQEWGHVKRVKDPFRTVRATEGDFECFFEGVRQAERGEKGDMLDSENR